MFDDVPEILCTALKHLKLKLPDDISFSLHSFYFLNVGWGV